MILDVYILDKDYNVLEVIDSYLSFIWTERYDQCGDFELYMPANADLLPYFKTGNYIWHKGADIYMSIDTVEIKSDTDGNTITVTGRSLEAILDRRIVWGQTILSGSAQTCVQKLLDLNVINPTDPARKIPNFTFLTSEEDLEATPLIDAQFMGESLYDAVYDICSSLGLGFRVEPVGAGGFEMYLYSGINRSYAQNERPYVIFSPNYDNLADSNYSQNTEDIRNAVLIGGEGEGVDKIFVQVASEDTGLSRRETYLESSSRSTDEDGNPIDLDVYLRQLAQEGRELLTEKNLSEGFDANVDATQQFIFGKDFFLGDIVQIQNEYGIEATARITEMVYSVDESGEKYVPTFTVIY